MVEKSSYEKYGFINLSPAMPFVAEDTLNIAGSQHPYYRQNDFAKMLQENEDIFLELVGCEGGRTIFLTSSGTGGMDAAINNLVSPSEKVLVINGGSFGQRWKDLCDFYQINSYNFQTEYGKQINFEELKKIFEIFRPSVILTQHVETSSGQIHNLKKVGELCREFDAKLIVDAIGSFVVEEYKMDEWNISATVVSSNKGLELFPGVAIVVLNKEICRKKRFYKRSYYLDFEKYLQHELTNCMAMPFTPNVNGLAQLNNKLNLIKSTGIEKYRKKFKKRAEDFRRAISHLPLKLVAEEPANCLSVIKTEKPGVLDFFYDLADKQKIFFSPSGGKEGKIINITHMGYYSEEDIRRFIKELEKWLEPVNVYIGGVWDLYHIGHLNVFKKAKEQGDKLIVGVNTDELIATYKDKKTIFSFEQRIELVQSCKYVDLAIPQEIFNNPEILKKYKIKKLVTGVDWKDKIVPGIEWAKENGIEVIYLDRTPGISTTDLIKKISQGYQTNQNYLNNSLLTSS
jgi:glycerol-3-phosphate cytidylyltransferase